MSGMSYEEVKDLFYKLWEIRRFEMRYQATFGQLAEMCVNQPLHRKILLDGTLRFRPRKIAKYGFAVISTIKGDDGKRYVEHVEWCENYHDALMRRMGYENFNCL